ncbi:MAG: nucleotidyltransferase domain-containing protein [Candidatus Heimdallarchaeaceae archaeon]
MHELITYFKEKLLEEYKEHIDLIVVYGSYARGTFNEFSDVDVFVLVDTEKRYSGITSLPWNFRYKNIGVDCWESIWSQQEENIESAKTSYFLYPLAGKLDCDIIYYRDEVTLAKFRDLQEEARKIIVDEKENVKLVEKQYKISDGVHNILKAQNEDDLLSARMSIWHVVFHMITALARLNNTYYIHNWGKNLREAYSMKFLPKAFESRVNFLVQTDNLSEALKVIIELDEEIKSMITDKTREILNPEKEEIIVNEEHIGIVEYLNKMRSSCKNRDLLSLSYEASELQLMVAEMIAFLEGSIERRRHYVPFSITMKDFIAQDLPDFSSIVTRGDFDEMVSAIEIFEEKIDLYLKDKSTVQNISNIDELKAIIESKIRSMKTS